MGKGIGIGFELGAPTTLNLKLMTTPDTGLVIGVGGGIWYDLSLSLHLDYIWHPTILVEGSVARLSWYIGGGGWASIATNSGPRLGYKGSPYITVFPVFVGVRVPIGLSLAFQQLPVEIFAEVAPAVELFPGIGVFGQGGIGARFYF